MSGAFHSRRRFDLVAVRHGRTAWNQSGRFQGHSDIALDDEGRAQAHGLGLDLAPNVFARAVSSDLSRAMETAQIVLSGRDVPLEIDARWREMRFGEWEGLTWPQIVEREPALKNASPKAPKFFTPRGGESFEDVCDRVRDALTSLDRDAGDHDVVLVATHAGPLHALLRVALGESEAEALAVRFDPATWTRLALAPEGTRLLDLNRPATARAR